MDKELIRLKRILLELLNEGQVLIEFEKKSGEIREMICTLSNRIIPLDQQVIERKKKENPEVIPVWDVGKGQWRSFRVDSVIKYERDNIKILNTEIRNKSGELINVADLQG